MKLLEQFKRTHLPLALVVDEFGGVEGLVSLTDVIGSIVGELPLEPGEEPAASGGRTAAGCSTARSTSTPSSARSTRGRC